MLQTKTVTATGKRLIRTWNRFRRELQEFDDKCRSNPVLVRVGAGDRLLQWLVIPSLSEIQDSIPDSQIELHNCTTRQVLERLHSYSLDLGIVRASEVPAGLKSFPLKSKFTYS